jgi:hypothetical protein
VSAGFSKKYGENFDRIFGKKPEKAKGHDLSNQEKKPKNTDSK